MVYALEDIRGSLLLIKPLLWSFEALFLYVPFMRQQMSLSFFLVHAI